MSLIEIKNYINGELTSPLSGEWLPNVDPAVGETYSQVPDSDEADIEAAFNAAHQAHPDWASRSAEQRSEILLRIADLIDQNSEELAEIESRDNGKPLTLARNVDIPRCSTNLRHFAATMVAYGSQSHASKGVLNYTLRQPLGVVGIISPWNLPLYLFTWKIAPALAAGNCVIGKPSEITPMTAFRFSQLCQQAGLPNGVLNVVHGSGARTGNALIHQPEIKAISFTGGTVTGRHVASIVAPQFKKLSLEMGGKNPAVVFDDCDFDNKLDKTMLSSFSNQGQICLCNSRILVQQPLYEKFVEALVARTQTLKVGDPREPDTRLGAIVSEPHFRKILAAIATAQAEGGRIRCGGVPLQPSGRCQNGFFIQPTVITDLPNDCSTNQQEIFGPVVTVQPFVDEAHALQLANDSQYGLSASIWTSDISRALRVAENIDVGVVWVNDWLVRDLRTPFGGVKQSGVGREGGDEAIRFFTQTKNISISY